MSYIGFYAPLKSPEHPNPSGDRKIARSLMQALQQPDGPDVRLMSELRTRDGIGDKENQLEIFNQAAIEIERIKSLPAPLCWVTYHNYYKAPDLIGPAIAGHFKIPYIQIESTRSKKRLQGPCENFARHAENACDAADVIFYFTERDRIALSEYKIKTQKLCLLRPFLPITQVPEKPAAVNAKPLRLLTVAMMRSGDKFASYQNLAKAMPLVTQDYRLTVLGDGDCRADIESLFDSDKTDFIGKKTDPVPYYENADIFLWPGINEAFGMVYLEAQSFGLPVIAENRSGVNEVVRKGGILTKQNDPKAYALAINELIQESPLRQKLSTEAKNQIRQDHMLHSAQQTLWQVLAPIIAAR